MRDHTENPEQRLRRIGLGTVQFGQPYGISNKIGRVPETEVRNILKLAGERGVGLLDTAAAYGTAETVLGHHRDETRDFKIVTKTCALKDGVQSVVSRARKSAELLRRKPVDFLLVHSAGDLRGPDGPALWESLLNLRDEGLFREIGISAYAADNPLELAEKFSPAAMQIPFSLLDQRLLRNGTLQRLKNLGVTIHIRSLFLQGLLFLKPEELPPNLTSAASHLRSLYEMISKADTDVLAAALGFVLSRPEVDVAIVGVTSTAELDQILRAATTPPPQLDWDACALHDERVLTPSRW